MLTNFTLFFLHSHDKNSIQSQIMFFQKCFAPFHFWTFFLSIFEKSKYFLDRFGIIIIILSKNKKVKHPKIFTSFKLFLAFFLLQNRTAWWCGPLYTWYVVHHSKLRSIMHVEQFYKYNNNES